MLISELSASELLLISEPFKRDVRRISGQIYKVPENFVVPYALGSAREKSTHKSLKIFF